MGNTEELVLEKVVNGEVVETGMSVEQTNSQDTEAKVASEKSERPILKMDQAAKAVEESVETDKPTDKVSKYTLAYEALDARQKLAWAQGWRPKELFKGANRDGTPREWIDHNQFLERTETNLPVANERIEELTRKLERIEREAQIARRKVEKAEKVGYEKAMQEILSKQEAAAEDGDLETFRHYRQQEEILRKAKEEGEKEFNEHGESLAEEKTPVQDKKPVAPPVPQLSDAESKILKNWMAENTWYKGGNSPIEQYAVGYASSLSSDPKTSFLSFQDRLDLVTQEIEETFGEKLGIKGRKTFVESGSRGNMLSKNTKTKDYSSLSKEEKTICENLIATLGKSGAEADKIRADFAKNSY